MIAACPDIAKIATVKQPLVSVCEACVKTGAEPGERWLYCYVDEVFAEY
jgi:hypothetical protein